MKTLSVAPKIAQKNLFSTPKNWFMAGVVGVAIAATPFANGNVARAQTIGPLDSVSVKTENIIKLDSAAMKEMAAKEYKAQFQRGDEEYRLGNDTTSISAYSKAIAIDSAKPKAYFNRAISYARLATQQETDTLKIECYKKAIEDFSRAIERNSLYANAYERRARCYLEIDEPEKAAQDINTAMELRSR